MTAQDIFDQIVKRRGITDVDGFVSPNYEALHDPMQLPDVKKAIERIKKANDKNQKVVIYGDYDIDGLTATTILMQALKAFGIKADYYMPDRFTEGYGLSQNGITKIHSKGADLIITVDCGSRSIEEIKLANTLGIDVIVTDHHELGDTLPAAVAVINPKRKDSQYPWRDLAGVGVAFKLIQALQSELDGFPKGQEKWLLDLVALGTVCDVVELLDENRTLVWWGLKVLSKTKRPGLQALAHVSGVDLSEVNSEDLGFRFGPRLNASGRLEHAEISLKLLMETKGSEALKQAQDLNSMNIERQTIQKKIFEEASAQADQYSDDPVLVLSAKDWSHGVNGIVASKIMEKYKKPTFILQELDEDTKGSGRSFGDYKLADAIKAAESSIIKGGGHAAAAGVTLKTKNIDLFRQELNKYYESLELNDQSKFLDPEPDIELSELRGLNLELIEMLSSLAPFGNGNLQPVFNSPSMTITDWRPVGADKTHAKVTLSDFDGTSIDGIGFGLAEIMPEAGSVAAVVYSVQSNTFNGRTTAQIQLIGVR